MACRAAFGNWRAYARGALVAPFLWLSGTGATAQEVITDARYHGETDDYAHCVLGDCIEYSVLEILSQDDAGNLYSRALRLWPSPFVFEDIAPRLWDVTGDGIPEVITVLTSFSRGAALAIYGTSGLIAQTPHIGQPNRWLAPVAAADFDDDGKIEIAYVDRPHLAKTLRLFEFSNGALSLEAELSNVSNHRIGDDFITGGLRDCGDGPEMVMASGDWQSVVVVRYPEGVLTAEILAPFSAGALASVMDCNEP